MQKAREEPNAFEIIIHSDKCQGCGNCIVVCPPNAERSPESGLGFGPRSDDVLLKIVRGQTVVVNSKLCNGCGNCVIACPRSAIEIIPLKPISAEAVSAVGEAPTGEIEKREEAKPISAEEIPAISPDEAQQIKSGLDSISDQLKTTRIRFFIELGRLQSAEEEIKTRLRHVKSQSAVESKKSEDERSETPSQNQ